MARLGPDESERGRGDPAPYSIPQDVGVGISAGQIGCRRRVCEWLTCRSSARVQVVWSPSGPQIAFM
jgi:hypothetical protein